jgi:hypothetical protein
MGRHFAQLFVLFPAVAFPVWFVFAEGLYLTFVRV